MKSTKIVLALAVLLSACNNPAPTTDQLRQVLKGRWVFNPAYCERMLPEEGLTDYLIENEGIRTGGVLAKGNWYRPKSDEAATLSANIETFIKDHSASCQEPLPTGQASLIVFESYEQKFVLAYYPDSDAVFRIVEESVIAGRRYDSEALKLIK